MIQQQNHASKFCVSTAVCEVSWARAAKVGSYSGDKTHAN